MEIFNHWIPDQIKESVTISAEGYTMDDIYDDIDTHAPGWEAWIWFKAGCAVGVDMIEKMKHAWRDYDFFSTMQLLDFSSDKHWKEKYRSGDFLDTLVLLAYQNWFTSTVWEIQHAADGQTDQTEVPGNDLSDAGQAEAGGGD